MTAIPIRNLYYLFCYAWELFPEAALNSTGAEAAPDVQSLFGRLLAIRTGQLIRRGLHREYRELHEELRSPRGKVLIPETIATRSQSRGALHCSHDELTADVPLNQILRATARLLAGSGAVDRPVREDLRGLVRKLSGISDVPLTGRLFGQLQLTAATRAYRGVITLCEFVWRAMMPDESGEHRRFSEILRDEVTMSKVFERFLRTFYSLKLPHESVSAEIMRWRGHAEEGSEWGLIPVMRTDVTIRSTTRVMVMDAKFYQNTLSVYHDKERFLSAHLFQLFSYMKHADNHGTATPVQGALIYAAAERPFHHRYRLDGHEVQISAIDLREAWELVEDRLLDVVTTPAEAAQTVGPSAAVKASLEPASTAA